MRPSRYFDWRQLAEGDAGEGFGAERNGRLRWALAAIAACAAIIFARVVALECFYGASYRREAAQPIRRVERTAGPRGRILARDGAVLAYDRQIAALAVHYRYLEQPPNPRWLEQLARRRVPRSQRGQPDRIEAERCRILAERAELHRRLAELCERSGNEFAKRAAEIQSRVVRIAKHVNERRRTAHAEEQARQAASRTAVAAGAGWLRRLGHWLAAIAVAADNAVPFSTIAVTEETDYHVVFEDLSLDAVAEIESHPERYAGVRIVERRRRTYPSGELAAHVLGHLALIDAQELANTDAPDLLKPRPGQAGEPESDAGLDYAPGDWTGRLGIERQFEPALRGRTGLTVEHSNRAGRVITTERVREPTAGRDLVLSIDPALQRLTDSLLDQTLARHIRPSDPELHSAGGAVVAMDVKTGAVLAAASAPRFDPNSFAAGDKTAVQAILDEPGHPLFDRTIRMAIPPGSVFKTLTAIALLESKTVAPEERFYCQGYLHQPTRQRCMIYRRHRRGHESIALADALAQSCNVYFFHFAEQAGPASLVEWAEKFGFGALTGIDLPDESPGALPRPATIRQEYGHAWREGDTLALAIGQGELTATPLQIVRLMAAVANGGRLVKPRIAVRFAMTADSNEAAKEINGDLTPSTGSSETIASLHQTTLAAVRRGLERVVTDPNGTGHRTVYCNTIEIAGKTGTAETGAGREDHAWFAGYAPAEAPVVAFVVVLEHAGSGSDAAGPIAKRLVQKMQSLGYFRRNRVIAKTEAIDER